MEIQKKKGLCRERLDFSVCYSIWALSVRPHTPWMTHTTCSGKTLLFSFLFVVLLHLLHIYHQSLYHFKLKAWAIATSGRCSCCNYLAVTRYYFTFNANSRVTTIFYSDDKDENKLSVHLQQTITCDNKILSLQPLFFQGNVCTSDLQSTLSSKPWSCSLWALLFWCASRRLWPQIYLPWAGYSCKRYTLGTMADTTLCKGQLIRPIILLCRPEEWTEKLWQPDANHRKQAARLCQLT